MKILAVGWIWPTGLIFLTPQLTCGSSRFIFTFYTHIFLTLKSLHFSLSSLKHFGLVMKPGPFGNTLLGVVLHWLSELKPRGPGTDQPNKQNHRKPLSVSTSYAQDEVGAWSKALQVDLLHLKLSKNEYKCHASKTSWSFQGQLVSQELQSERAAWSNGSYCMLSSVSAHGKAAPRPGLGPNPSRRIWDRISPCFSFLMFPRSAMHGTLMAHMLEITW